MNESALRWRARIGSLKALSVIVIIGAGAFLVFAAISLLTAVNNPGGPQKVSIHDLVSGKVGTSKYVTVEGVAFYETGYEETTDGKVTETYYYLADEKTGDVVLVRAAEPKLVVLEEIEEVTLEGMTERPESDLKKEMEADLSELESEGVTTTTTLILHEGRKPASVPLMGLAVILLGGLILISLIPFFFPGTVFGAAPLPQPEAAPGPAGLQAVGKFVQLKKVEPTIEVGKANRKFENAVANLIQLDSQNLMVYIHHVMTTRAYGVQVAQQHSHWGIFLDPSRVTAVEAGKLYGWKDRWAVRVQYQDARQKSESLVLSFDTAAAQVNAVGLLRQMGFPITMM